VNEALELMDSEKFALTLIDENMPGIPAGSHSYD
jgi:CheY-like chemotaxis protein